MESLLYSTEQKINLESIIECLSGTYEVRLQEFAPPRITNIVIRYQYQKNVEEYLTMIYIEDEIDQPELCLPKEHERFFSIRYASPVVESQLDVYRTLMRCYGGNITRECVSYSLEDVGSLIGLI